MFPDLEWLYIGNASLPLKQMNNKPGSSLKAQPNFSNIIKQPILPAVVAEWSKALSQIQVERMP